MVRLKIFTGNDTDCLPMIRFWTFLHGTGSLGPWSDRLHFVYGGTFDIHHVTCLTGHSLANWFWMELIIFFRVHEAAGSRYRRKKNRPFFFQWIMQMSSESAGLLSIDFSQECVAVFSLRNVCGDEQLFWLVAVNWFLNQWVCELWSGWWGGSWGEANDAFIYCIVWQCPSGRQQQQQHNLLGNSQLIPPPPPPTKKF